MKSTLLEQKTQFSMGTIMSHNANDFYAEDCLTAVCREVSRLESKFSRFIHESEINKINQSAGNGLVKVSSETIEILTKSFQLASQCNGLFDITIAPLIALWNIGYDSFKQPSESEIQKALPLVNYHDLILNSSMQTAGLDKIGQSIDLGGIGKGYAADCILEIYRSFGVISAYSNLGGNVVTLGAKPDGSPWHIGIQHPRQQDRLLGTVSVINQSVVTSGDYQRFSTDPSGRQFHHIFNPFTGYPVESGLVSVTIVTENSMTADVLSTALFVLGINNGFELLKSFPKIEAIFVDVEEQVFVTNGLKNLFQPEKNVQFTLI